jgi:hypothetical protein
MFFVFKFKSAYRQPLSKYSLRYDKLLVDKDVYVFNELSGLVERVGSGIQEEMDFTASSSPTTPYRSFHSFQIPNVQIRISETGSGSGPFGDKKFLNKFAKAELQ